MIEFIVNLKTGHFVSEWNAYEHHVLTNGQIDSDPTHYTNDELKQIADTESFNYGKAGTKSHNNLDVEHPKGYNDAQVRVRATSEYDSPTDYNPDDKSGNYADIVKHESDIEAWRNVPDNKKEVAYNGYLDWKKQGGQKSKGFSSYLNR